MSQVSPPVATLGASANGHTPTPPSTLRHEALNLFLTNHFNDCQAFIKRHYHDDIGIPSLNAFVTFIRSVGSDADGDLSGALNATWTAEAMALKISKTAPKQSFDYIAARLIQADMYLIGALIQQLQQSYIKALLNVRSSYNYYHDAHKLIQTYQGDGRDELLGWANYGIGLFNLMLSLLPPSVVRVFGWIGFPGDRTVALTSLTASYQSSAVMAPIAALVLLMFYLSISSFTGDDDASLLVDAKRLLDWVDARYPNSAVFAQMHSRLMRVERRLRDAIVAADQGLKQIEEFPAISIVFLFQKAWCAFFLLEWQEAANYFDDLLHNTPGGDYDSSKLYFPPAAPSSTAATSSTTVISVAGTDRSRRKPATRAGLQAMYAYQCSLCYSMLDDYARADWYLLSVHTWLPAHERPLDTYADHRAAELLKLTSEQRRAVVLLNIAELFHSWSGLPQMDDAARSQFQSLLHTAHDTYRQVWSVHDLARYKLYIAALARVRQEYNDALRQLTAALATYESDLAAVKKSRQSSKYDHGVLAYIYYELALTQFDLKQYAASRENSRRAAAISGYDLYNIWQVRLHALSAKIERTEKTEKEAEHKEKK